MNKATLNALLNRTMLNKLSFFIGGILIFATGMLYVLIADLGLKVRAVWLLIASLLSIGSAACFLLSERLQDNRTWFILIKSIAAFLCLAFIIFIIIYLHSALTSQVTANSNEFKNNIFALKKIFKDEERTKTLLAGILPIVLGSISLVCQVGNIVLTVTDKQDD